MNSDLWTNTVSTHINHEAHAEIERQTREFLERGGVIKRVGADNKIDKAPITKDQLKKAKRGAAMYQSMMRTAMTAKQRRFYDAACHCALDKVASTEDIAASMRGVRKSEVIDIMRSLNAKGQIVLSDDCETVRIL